MAKKAQPAPAAAAAQQPDLMFTKEAHPQIVAVGQAVISAVRAASAGNSQIGVGGLLLATAIMHRNFLFDPPIEDAQAVADLINRVTRFYGLVCEQRKQMQAAQAAQDNSEK